MNVVASLILASVVLGVQANVIVKTSSGDVEGVEVNSILQDEKYYSFMGIPYALPPLGELRFMPPKPHPSWSETLIATKEKKPCAQFYFPSRTIKRYGYCGDEDCLHLSIHTPKPPPYDETYPVIVFLHNEQYRISHNSSRDFGPDFFMKEGVIIVTINHRLGAIGFLSFEDSLLLGNNGLRDVILGLKWLKENIHNFGGDSNRITLMGHQDGAGLVDILLHSPKAKGLYNGVILQSGTSWSSNYFVENPRKTAIEFSKSIGEDATSSTFLLKRFSDVSAKKISENEYLAVDADVSRAIQRAIFTFGPTIEHEHPEAVITVAPEDKPIDIDVPVMIGYNSREGIEFVERFLQKPQYLTFADRDFMLLFPVRTGYKFKLRDKIYNNVVDEIKDFYFEEGYVKTNKPGEYITYVGDIMSFYAIDYTARKYANESKAPVYYYTFDYSGELNMRKNNIMKKVKSTDGTWGASLADDLCYLFVCKRIKKSYVKALQEDDSEEINVLNNMVRMWSNFAKTGNPTPKGEDLIWEPVTKENKNCLVISDEPQIKKDLHKERVEFWDEFLAKYKNLAADGVVADIKEEL